MIVLFKMYESFVIELIQQQNLEHTLLNLPVGGVDFRIV